LDWELSTIGHPLSDVANLLMLFYVPHNIHPILQGLQGVDPAAIGYPSEEDVLKLYCAERNREYPIPGWRFCVAFAFFRVWFFIHIVKECHLMSSYIAHCDYTRDSCQSAHGPSFFLKSTIIHLAMEAAIALVPQIYERSAAVIIVRYIYTTDYHRVVYLRLTLTLLLLVVTG
jgi:hypothetical protein